MAIASYDSWREYALFTGTSFGLHMRTLGPNGQHSVLKKQKQGDNVIEDAAFNQRITVNANLGVGNPARKDAEDMVKIHKFIAGVCG